MSYMDTGDDELDYGEGELGEGAAAGVSLGPADDDDMAQEDEYEDLYDDVNIGLFETPVFAAEEGYEMDDGSSFDQKPDMKPNIAPVQPDKIGTEHVPLAPPPPLASTQNLPQVFSETFRSIKIEPKVEPKDEDWSRQEMVHMHPASQKKETVCMPASGAINGKDTGQVRPMQVLLSPSTKTQGGGGGYNNGLRQGDLTNTHTIEKPYSPYNVKAAGATPAAGNGESLSGSAPTGMASQVSTHPGGTLSAGRGKSAVGASDNIKDRGNMEDMPYDRTRGATGGPLRPAQRDLSPNVTDYASRQHAGSENVPRPSTQAPYSGDGSGMLFVGDLHWWTTDAELEAALSEYGRVKNLKFYEERVSGKSKGYCQVEFYDHAAAVACKQGMNGRKFHERPCIVALGNARSIQLMGYQQEKKTQAQFQAQQEHMASRRTNVNNTGGMRGGGSFQERDMGRGYGRSSRVGQGPGMGNKIGQVGGGRGRGSYMNKGTGSGGGGNAGSGLPYGQGLSGPMGGHQSAMMMHQGMMGQGYDPAYGPMGRGGAAYGGYVMPGPPFPGIVAPFPALGPGGLPGVAPHVNPAFFGRSVGPNGMGLMPGGSMDQGMWGDASLGAWGGEEHDRRARDGSYGDDGGGTDYGYNNDMGHEKSRKSVGWEKENGDWSERHRRDDSYRDGDWERESYKEKDRDVYREQRDMERSRDRDDDWERERAVRTRTKSRVVDEEDDPRHRSREEEYGRKRRVTERELSNM